MLEPLVLLKACTGMTRLARIFRPVVAQHAAVTDDVLVNSSVSAGRRLAPARGMAQRSFAAIVRIFFQFTSAFAIVPALSFWNARKTSAFKKT